MLKLAHSSAPRESTQEAGKEERSTAISIQVNRVAAQAPANPDRWVTSLKQWTCDACGNPIWAGNPHWVFYVKPGRNNTQRLVCWRCIVVDEGGADGL